MDPLKMTITFPMLPQATFAIRFVAANNGLTLIKAPEWFQTVDSGQNNVAIETFCSPESIRQAWRTRRQTEMATF